MFDRFVTAITDLPVIVQGALGSGLFALLLYIGQQVMAYGQEKYANSSRKRKKQALIDESTILHLVSTENRSRQTFYAIAALYRTAHYLVRALVWLTLGLVFSSTISVFGVVGYVGCLYYLFQCLRMVRGGKSEGAKERLAEIDAELDAMNTMSKPKSEV